MTNRLERITARNWNRAVPMSALIELTFACNHACSFCYNRPNGEREMSTDEVIDSLSKLADLNILYLTLSGGEPLLRQDFFEIAAAARALGFAIRIYTNGYLIDAAMARRIKEVAYPVEMEISIHGARPETHDSLTRVPGSFQRLLDAVRALRGEGVRVVLKCVVTKINQEEVLEIERLGRDLDAQVIFDLVVTPRDDGDLEPLTLMATDDFLQRFWKDEAYASARKGRVPEPRVHGPGEAICGAARSTMAIDPYGNIYPCVQLRKSAGNIRELFSLKEMWQSSPIMNRVRTTAVDVAQRVMKEAENGAHCQFCMGVAELQMGDPTKLYPQAERSAAYRKKAYESLRR